MAQVTVKDSNGNESGSFRTTDDESLATQIQDQNIPIVIGCGVGACSMCKCKVNKGMEYIDPEANGPAQFPIEDDEILSCISGIKDGTPQDAEIELEIENI